MVRAAVGFFAVGSLFVVVSVECGEVAGVQAQFLIDVPCTTKADTVTVASKRGVLLITVRETVVCTLSTTADSELLVDIPLDTCEDFVGAVGTSWRSYRRRNGIPKRHADSS